MQPPFQRALLTLLFAVGCLVACTSFVPQEPVDWQKRNRQIQPIQHWQSKGVMGIQTASHETITANFEWAQCGSRYFIYLFGPFGVGHAELIGNADQITLITADKRRYTASDPEQLLQQQLGFSLPVKNLHYWMRALAAPGEKASSTFNASHHLDTLKQQEWDIVYFNYKPIQHIEMPTKIWATHDQLKTRIAIHEWKFSASSAGC